MFDLCFLAEADLGLQTITEPGDRFTKTAIFLRDISNVNLITSLSNT